MATSAAAGGAANWPSFGDRPKSANVVAQSGAGMNSSIPNNNRPTSSTPVVSSAAGQWNSGPSSANLTTNTTANSLSYGSLKNRFLSGTTTSKSGGVAGVAAVSNSNTAGPSANPNSSKSKLFSLAR